MICRFCMQWNEERSTRCCFCDNTLTATEDATFVARPSAALQGLAGPARPAGQKLRTVSADDQQLARHGALLDKAKLVWSIVIAVGVILYLFCRVKFRC